MEIAKESEFPLPATKSTVRNLKDGAVNYYAHIDNIYKEKPLIKLWRTTSES